MRVMVIVKATADSETGRLPTADEFAEMGAFNEALAQAGILQMADGLKPTSAARRVRFSGKDRTVIDGPFGPAQDQIAGFWIWNVKSMEEAIAWVKRCPNPMREDSDIEIRPFFEAEDLGDGFTPELQAKLEKQREKIADNQRRG